VVPRLKEPEGEQLGQVEVLETLVAEQAERARALG